GRLLLAGVVVVDIAVDQQAVEHLVEDGAGPAGGVPGGGDLDLVARVEDGAAGRAGRYDETPGRVAVIQAPARLGVGRLRPGSRRQEHDSESDRRAGGGGHEGATSKSQAKHGFSRERGGVVRLARDSEPSPPSSPNARS